MKAVETASGNYYVAQRCEKEGRNYVFTVKGVHMSNGYLKAYVTIKNIIFPTELIGKKIRLKIEFADNEVEDYNETKKRNYYPL